VRPSENFKSFFAPALNFTDTHAQSSWLGPWTWLGTVRPVPGGGIPMHIPRVEVKFTFKDGGHSEFQQKYEWLKERLVQAQELGLSPGQNLEPPPPYEDNAPEPSSGPSGNAPAGAGETQQQQQQQQQSQAPQPTPNEPPPDYVEAQTQAISIQYEQRMREEAERQ
jgi:WW domain-binding protein 2